MADNLMFTHNDDTQNYSFCRFQSVQCLKRLYTQLNEPTNQNSMKIPKFFKPTNNENLIITFRDSNVPSLLADKQIYIGKSQNEMIDG